MIKTRADFQNARVDTSKAFRAAREKASGVGRLRAAEGMTAGAQRVAMGRVSKNGLTVSRKNAQRPPWVSPGHRGSCFSRCAFRRCFRSPSAFNIKETTTTRGRARISRTVSACNVRKKQNGSNRDHSPQTDRASPPLHVRVECPWRLPLRQAAAAP